MNIKGAIFDVDGTLLDSMYVWETIGEEYLRSLGIEPHEDLNAKFRNMSLYQAACHYRSEYGVKLGTSEIMDGVNGMIEHCYYNDVQIKHGVMEFLEKLRDRGTRMCIATATDVHLVEAALRRTGIYGYFEGIFTCTSVGSGKDEPAIFNEALRSLGTAKENTVVFEDALYAVRTAKEAGYYVAAVYDSSAREIEEIKGLADAYLKDYSEAEAVLL